MYLGREEQELLSELAEGMLHNSLLLGCSLCNEPNLRLDVRADLRVVAGRGNECGEVENAWRSPVVQ